jgi:hypothetical protein
MSKPLPKKYKLRGSFATYRMPDRKNDVCDLEELCNQVGSVGNIPERMGFTKASEIAWMARWCLTLWRAHKQRETTQHGYDPGAIREQLTRKPREESRNAVAKPDYYTGGTYVVGQDPEVTCKHCNRTFLCDMMDATCRLCGKRFTDPTQDGDSKDE